jgi:hypothetical protein
MFVLLLKGEHKEEEMKLTCSEHGDIYFNEVKILGIYWYCPKCKRLHHIRIK